MDAQLVQGRGSRLRGCGAAFSGGPGRGRGRGPRRGRRPPRGPLRPAPSLAPGGSGCAATCRTRAPAAAASCRAAARGARPGRGGAGAARRRRRVGGGTRGRPRRQRAAAGGMAWRAPGGGPRHMRRVTRQAPGSAAEGGGAARDGAPRSRPRLWAAARTSGAAQTAQIPASATMRGSRARILAGRAFWGSQVRQCPVRVAQTGSGKGYEDQSTPSRPPGTPSGAPRPCGAAPLHTRSLGAAIERGRRPVPLSAPGRGRRGSGRPARPPAPLRRTGVQS
jgi:hypothetical protein